MNILMIIIANGYFCGTHQNSQSNMISNFHTPSSKKKNIEKPQTRYAAVAFFYRQGKPLVLCEIATSRFRFFEDVDLLLPAELKNEVAPLQDLWVEHLLRHRGAVLGAVWRSDDPLGN